MTAHRHAALIKAKADNMELVVFCRDSYDNTNKWQETSHLPMQEEFDYFLCLPQHKESCLHWLNGGGCQLRLKDSWGAVAATKEEVGEWRDSLIWMKVQEIRIKPSKEKRWIIVDVKTNNTSFAYSNKEVALGDFKCAGSSSQLIEIEIEV